jgi:hypothetical protein
MKISELRIGNYIHTKGGELCTIFQLCGEDEKIKDKINYINIDEFKPIPIDLEWLEEFKFHIIKIKKEYSVYSFDDFNRINITEYAYYYQNYMGTKPIKYVHELQNIYFSINGKELKLK